MVVTGSDSGSIVKWLKIKRFSRYMFNVIESCNRKTGHSGKPK